MTINIDNLDQWGNEAKEYFFQKVNDISYHKQQAQRDYRAVTNIMLLNMDVEYIVGDVEQTLKNLIAANPYSELMQRFGSEFGFDLVEVLKSADSEITEIDIDAYDGYVRIGSDAFHLLVPCKNINGNEEVKVRILVTSQKRVPMDHFATVEGDINIYDYNADKLNENEITGKYEIYISEYGKKALIVLSKVHQERFSPLNKDD